MRINRLTSLISNKLRLSNLTLEEISTPLQTAKTAKLDENFLLDKNGIISGELFPTSKSVFIKRLLSRKVNLQPQMTPETEILICGKYPDWILVKEAKLYGLKIIFIDKAGELFSRLTINLNEGKTFSYEEPLGV